MIVGSVFSGCGLLDLGLSLAGVEHAWLGYDTQWDCVPAAAFGAPHLRDRVIAVAEDPHQRPLESGGLRRGEREADQGATADADRNGLRQQPEPEPRSCGAPVARGIAVEWGDYEPAIRRWETVHGPAPQPLVRRVDDRRAARVERSRLSALGDGVQVQLGLMVGEFLMRASA